MNSWVVRVLVISASMLLISNAYSEEKTNVDKARDALAKTIYSRLFDYKINLPCL